MHKSSRSFSFHCLSTYYKRRNMLRLNEGLRCHHERADKITQGSLRQYHQMTASVSWHPLHHLSRNTTYDTARGKKLAREREKKNMATNCTRAQSKTEHGPVTDNVVRKEVPQMSNHRVHVKHYLYLTYLQLDTLKSSYRAVEQYSESIRRLLPCRNIWSHAQRSLC